MSKDQKPAEVVYIRKDQLAKAKISPFLCDVGPNERADKEPIYTEEQVQQAVREAAPKKTCEWALDYDFDWGDTWDSACGEKWSFNDGGPKENRVRFCQGCGGEVAIAAAQDVKP